MRSNVAVLLLLLLPCLAATSPAMADVEGEGKQAAEMRNLRGGGDEFDTVVVNFGVEMTQTNDMFSSNQNEATSEHGVQG